MLHPPDAYSAGANGEESIGACQSPDFQTEKVQSATMSRVPGKKGDSSSLRGAPQRPLTASLQVLPSQPTVFCNPRYQFQIVHADRREGTRWISGCRWTTSMAD